MDSTDKQGGEATMATTALRAWLARKERPEHAIEVAAGVLSSSECSSHDKARAGAALSAALLLLHRHEEAMTAAQDVLGLVDAEAVDYEVLCEAHRCVIRCALPRRDVVVSLRHARLGLDVAERSGNQKLLALAHSDSATAFGVAGMYERAMEHIQLGIQLLDDDDDGAMLAAPLNNLGNIYLELDRPVEALAVYGRSRVAHLANATALGAAIARTNEGRALVALGRADEAVHAQIEALQEFRQSGYADYVPPTQAKLAAAHAAVGDMLMAEACYRDAVEGHEQGHGAIFEADTRRDFGKFLIGRHRDHEALAQLTRALRLFREHGIRNGAVQTLRLLASANENLGDAPAALRDLKDYVEEQIASERERGDLRAKSQIIDLEVSLARQHEVSRLTTQALADANRELRSQAQRLEQLSSTDHLTGLHNRRSMSGRLADEVSRAERHGLDLSLVLIDVDSFKHVNDQYSHSVGDLVLSRVADVLRRSFRRSDIVARWGGEEFAILLPSTLKREALLVADKARKRVASHDWGVFGEGLQVTVSVGVVSLLEDTNLDLESLLRLADQRLYVAKNGGRNRTVADDGPSALNVTASGGALG